MSLLHIGIASLCSNNTVFTMNESDLFHKPNNFFVAGELAYRNEYVFVKFGIHQGPELQRIIKVK